MLALLSAMTAIPTMGINIEPERRRRNPRHPQQPPRDVEAEYAAAEEARATGGLERFCDPDALARPERSPERRAEQREARKARRAQRKRTGFR